MKPASGNGSVYAVWWTILSSEWRRERGLMSGACRQFSKCNWIPVSPHFSQDSTLCPWPRTLHSLFSLREWMHCCCSPTQPRVRSPLAAARNSSSQAIAPYRFHSNMGFLPLFVDSLSWHVFGLCLWSHLISVFQKSCKFLVLCRVEINTNFCYCHYF